MSVRTSLSMEDEIARLRSLDLLGLQSRWRSVVGRPGPEHLPKHLLFGTLAYRIQADALGDLDAGKVQLLKRAYPAVFGRGFAACIGPKSAQARDGGRHRSNAGVE